MLATFLLSGCVDAIDQKAQECEQAMLPGILAKAKSMPSDETLKAKGAEIEHWLKGGEKRLRLIRTRIHANWKSTKIEPVDEVNFVLFLTEDAVGFPARAERRTKELCSFAEANRVKYQSWWISAPRIADYVTQTPSGNTVEEVAAE